CFFCTRRPPRSPLFPYTTLFRSGVAASGARAAALGIAAEASGSQRFQISLPDLVLALAEFTEIAPGVDACLVEIVEDQSDRVIPLGPDLHDADVTSAGDDRLLPWAVPHYLGGRTLHPKELGGQGERLAVVEGDVETLLGSLQADLDRPVGRVEIVSQASGPARRDRSAAPRRRA